MRLRRVEWISILITVLFFAGLVGYRVYLQRDDSTSSLTAADEALLLQTDASVEAAEPETEAVTDKSTSDTVTGTIEQINLNTASIEQLITLPGVGGVLAERIIAYREANGGFASIEEIMNVKGIADGKFETIRDLICVTLVENEGM